MNSVLHLAGIARKAGKLEVGEEPVGAAARARQAKVILLAADAADNSVRRAGHFAQAGNTALVQLPCTKAEIGAAVGRTSCAMLAVTDAGLAAAMLKKLSQSDPERYGEAAAALEQKAAKVFQRQKEQRTHEKKLQRAKKAPWAPPPRTAAQKPGAEKTVSPPARRAAPKGRIQIKGALRRRPDAPSEKT